MIKGSCEVIGINHQVYQYPLVRLYLKQKRYEYDQNDYLLPDCHLFLKEDSEVPQKFSRKDNRRTDYIAITGSPD